MASKAPSYLRNGREIVSGIQKLAYRHPAYQIFQDWLEISAIAISNSVDLANFEDREKRYLELINQYKEEQNALVELFATLVRNLTDEVETSGTPRDVLGEVFHGLELHNKYKGQFFTPNHICEFMGRAVLAGDTEEVISERGFVSVCEPCVGSGGLVIGLAAAMAYHKHNYQTELVVTACDIDIKCVHIPTTEPIRNTCKNHTRKLAHRRAVVNLVHTDLYSRIVGIKRRYDNRRCGKGSRE